LHEDSCKRQKINQFERGNLTRHTCIFATFREWIDVSIPSSFEKIANDEQTNKKAERCFEFRKAKTKEIIPANHKRQRQYSQPITTRGNKWRTRTRRGKTCASESGLVLVLTLIG